MQQSRYVSTIVPVLLLLLLLNSCYRKEIEFGGDLPDNNNQLVNIDTVMPVLSSIILDSFVTSGNSILQVGNVADPVMGDVMASTYFQFAPPSDIPTELQTDAIFDSLVIVLKPKHEYYGDTTKAQTFILSSLMEQPEYGYNDKLYNTSSVPVTSTLATYRKAVSPMQDSLLFKLPEAMGKDFWEKIKARTIEMTDEAAFRDFFKGVRLHVDINDRGGLYTFSTDTSVTMQLHYHVTRPQLEERVFTFPLTRTTHQFNRLLFDRRNTDLAKQPRNLEEFFATPEYPYSFSQAGAGVLMKIKFPSLRGILGLNKLVKILKADLILKPLEDNWDPYIYRLPPALYLVRTDATNNIGDPIPNSDGSSVQLAAPSIDWLYREDTKYSFDVTGYMSALLSYANATEEGVYVLEEYPGSAKTLHRVMIGSPDHLKYKTQLKLTVLLIP